MYRPGTAASTIQQHTTAHKWIQFFITKIDKITDSLVPTEDNPIDNWFIGKHYLTHLSLNSFTPVTTEEMIRSLNKSPAKLCELDPLPTALLKRVGKYLSLHLTSFINESINTGTFSNILKQALSYPLVKKVNLLHFQKLQTGVQYVFHLKTPGKDNRLTTSPVYHQHWKHRASTVCLHQIPFNWNSTNQSENWNHNCNG